MRVHRSIDFSFPIPGHLEKLLKAKDITPDKKSEIERLLPQVGRGNSLGI